MDMTKKSVSGIHLDSGKMIRDSWPITDSVLYTKLSGQYLMVRDSILLAILIVIRLPVNEVITDTTIIGYQSVETSCIY